DNSTNEDHFQIERQEGSGGFRSLAQVDAGITSYRDTGLTPGVPYTYRVLAQNLAGDSDPSNTAAVTIPVGGRLSISPQRLSFGLVRVHRAKQISLQVRNTGRGQLVG